MQIWLKLNTVRGTEMFVNMGIVSQFYRQSETGTRLLLTSLKGDSPRAIDVKETPEEIGAMLAEGMAEVVLPGPRRLRIGGI